MRIVHVYNEYGSTEDRLRRVKRSWQTLKEKDLTGYVLRPVQGLLRTGLVGPGGKGMPFWKDVVSSGLHGIDQEDLILFTNADSYLACDSLERIREHVAYYGIKEPIYSYRMNWYKQLRWTLTSEQINRLGGSANITGEHFKGVDAVVFSRSWWIDNRDDLPDLLIGFQGWDYLIRNIGVCLQGKIIPNEINKWKEWKNISIVAHEMHGMPYWQKNLHAPGNIYNWQQMWNWQAQRKDFIPTSDWEFQSLKI